MHFIKTTGYTAQLKYECVGRNFFSPGPGRVKELANGKSLWIGTFLSVRVGWKVRLNVDMANKPAYEEGKLTLLVQFKSTFNLKTKQ